MDDRRVYQKITAALKRREFPCRTGLGLHGKPVHKMLRRLAHDLGQRPVLGVGNGLEPLLERVGKLDLGAGHDDK